MVKSLGDYNKEKSSSSDLKNIQWNKKNLQNFGGITAFSRFFGHDFLLI